MADMVYIKRVIGSMLQPSWIILAILIVAVFFVLSRGWLRRPIGWLCLAAGTALFALTVFPQPVRLAAGLLGKSYQPVLRETDAESPYAIVVLGSGVEFPGDPQLPALTRLSDAARARLVEGVRLARLYPEARLITCGYGFGSESCADAMAEAAIELGVEPDRIDRLDQVMDTQQEAETVTRRSAGRPLIVVTTAVHMERAMEYFQQSGADAIASPCDYIAPPSAETLDTVKKRRWLPGGRYITANEKTWHEYLGLLHMRLGNRQ